MWECKELPCQKLIDLFNDPEHGDKGARLRNLQNWKKKDYRYEKLENKSQKQSQKNNGYLLI